MNFYQSIVFFYISISFFTFGNPIATVDQVLEDANYILSCMTSDGAINNGPITSPSSSVFVSPYQSNYASMGLSRASAFTSNNTFEEASWNWLMWYQSHQNESSGYITDYKGVPGNLTSTGEMDSTDSYAGTFLMACLQAYKVHQNLTKLKLLQHGIELAVAAIESTQASDGLTWALPTYHVQYLMDAAETYAGLIAALEMALLLGDQQLYERVVNDSIRMYEGAQNLWNSTDLSFNRAVYNDGQEQLNNWEVFYPDAASQMWAVGYGLSNDTEAQSIISIFLEIHPQWDIPTSSDTFYNSSGGYVQGQIFYWPAIAFAFLCYNMSNKAYDGISSIREAAINASRGWPFTPSDQGLIILAETGECISTETTGITGTTGISGTTGTTSSLAIQMSSSFITFIIIFSLICQLILDA